MFKRNSEPKSINFLEPINQGNDFFENSFSWLTTVGKWLLIVVEMVVLGVFFSRFILDEKSNDLTEEVNAQVSVLENDTWRQSAVKYDNLQNLFSDIKVIGSGQKINSSLISELLDTIPMTLNVNSFSFNGNRVSISLVTTNFKALKDYEDALKNNTYYSDVKFNITKSNDELEVNVSFLINTKDTVSYAN